MLLSGEAGPVIEQATGSKEAAKYFRQVRFWNISSVIRRSAQLAGDCEVNRVLFPSYCRSCPGFELAYERVFPAGRNTRIVLTELCNVLSSDGGTSSGGWGA